MARRLEPSSVVVEVVRIELGNDASDAALPEGSHYLKYEYTTSLWCYFHGILRATSAPIMVRERMRKTSERL